MSSSKVVLVAVVVTGLAAFSCSSDGATDRKGTLGSAASGSEGGSSQAGAGALGSGANPGGSGRALGGAFGLGGVGGGGASLELEPEVGFLYLVDPARCLIPCAGDPTAHLVTIGPDGMPNAAGDGRVARWVQPPLRALLVAAAEAGQVVTAGSSFRNYETQRSMWSGGTEIGRFARPGHSEHQIGTAVDLNFGSVAAQTWAMEHAFERGFAMSFRLGDEKLTGIRYEPWHYRYVGVEAAAEIHNNGWSVVEYLRAHPELARFGDCGDCPAPESLARCGSLDWAGKCEGQVVRFCLDGAAGAVDCSTTGQSCSLDSSGEAACR